MIPINLPLMDKEEQEAVINVLESGMLTDSNFDGGFRVRDFEKTIADFVGTKFAIAVNSGTSALLASLLSLEIKKDDEILLPSFTFVSTANVVLLLGAKPIFVDIDLKNYTIDADDLERKITKRSKAVIPVHLYGHTANMDKIVELAQDNDLYIIEDSAQSLGSSYKGKQTGSFGDLGCFSFYPSKIVTCGEGGAIVTNNEDLYFKIKKIRNNGIKDDYNPDILGINLRMTEIAAALILVQMKKIYSFLEKRRKNAKILSELLGNVNGIRLPQEEKGHIYNWYLYTIFLDKNRDEVLKKIKKNGIGAMVYYKIPIHKTSLYSKLGYNEMQLSKTMLASEHVLSLPVHPALEYLDLKNMSSSLITTINNIFKS